jgi:hypothetical protein
MEFTNWLGIIAAAVASMVVGYIWYGPLFGKAWMKLMGIKDMADKSEMPKIYGIMFVASLVTAYVLLLFGASIDTAFWVWLGFQAPLLLNSVLFEKKPWNLYFINAGYQLAALVTMSFVLSYFG